MRCAVCDRLITGTGQMSGSCQCDKPDPMIPWSKVKEIHNEGKIVGRLKIMHRLAILLREYEGGAR